MSIGPLPPVGSTTPPALPAAGLRNPGLNMPMPVGGFGLVHVDFDKTICEGNSHMGLIRHGLQTRAEDIQRLEGKWNRLWETLKMTWRYNLHRLDPSSAREAVATQLDGVPILPVAREWADAAARASLKRGVLRLVHERAREIVRKEVAQLIREGRMSGPLSDADLEEEARTRIFVVSSQFAQVLRMLTDVGPDHENMLAMNPENVLGSGGTFDAEGRFVNDDRFVYCFDENKPRVARAELERRGIKADPKTTEVFTDDVHYDRFLLTMAEDPRNRTIVDPGERDAAYAYHEGAGVVYDRVFLYEEGGWTPVPGKKGKRRYEARVVKSFFPDSESVATGWAYWLRSIYGAIEMSPLVAGEAIMHGIGGDSHPAALAIPLGAGLIYGPMNRQPMAHAVIGALIGGGLSVVHQGYPVTAAIVGAISFPLVHFLQGRLWFERKAQQLGHDGFKSWTRTFNLFSRIAASNAWALGMRMFGLG